MHLLSECVLGDGTDLSRFRLPTDRDYHELSCKRRYKQNRSDNGDKSAKSSTKPAQSGGGGGGGSSSNSEGVNGGVCPGGAVGTLPGAFELPEEVMAELKAKLGNIIPTGANDGRDGTGSLSRNGFEGQLEQLLEPYIKEIINSKFLGANGGFPFNGGEFRDNDGVEGAPGRVKCVTKESG